MAVSISTSFSINDKALHAFLVSLSDEPLPPAVPEIIENAFTELAGFIHDKSQVIYVRDIGFLAIDGKYAGGHCYNRHEAMIAVPDWRVPEEQIVAAVNHELHHMARWQNAGYGSTLGGAILSEGIATYYEKLRSGWSSPWAVAKVNQDTAQKALAEWDNENYDHNAWFFDDEHGKWAGYALGMQLAAKIYKSGFNLKDSVTITPDRAKALFSQVVNEL